MAAEHHDTTPLRRPLSDAAGFGELYAREAQTVLTFCVRRVLDAETAVDLTAETFAQAFRGRRGFRGSTEAEARAWLLTIARRLVARFHERGRLDRSAVQRLGIQVPRLSPGEAEEVERRAGLPELRRVVGEELATLSAEQREALQLRVVEERSYAEIAERVGVSQQTVRARVSRGLRALSQSLDLQAVRDEGAA